MNRKIVSWILLLSIVLFSVPAVTRAGMWHTWPESAPTPSAFLKMAKTKTFDITDGKTGHEEAAVWMADLDRKLLFFQIVRQDVSQVKGRTVATLYYFDDEIALATAIDKTKAANFVQPRGGGPHSTADLTFLDYQNAMHCIETGDLGGPPDGLVALADKTKTLISSSMTVEAPYFIIDAAYNHLLSWIQTNLDDGKFVDVVSYKVVPRPDSLVNIVVKYFDNEKKFKAAQKKFPREGD